MRVGETGVGEMGVGETGQIIGETGVGETGVGEMGVIRSDIHNTPVIATRLHCDGSAYFLSAIDTGTNKKTASYCTSVAQQSIQEANLKFSIDHSD